jgi:hypothetical protein
VEKGKRKGNCINKNCFLGAFSGTGIAGAGEGFFSCWGRDVQIT